MALEGKILAVEALSDGQRDAMFALMDRYYDHMTRAQFEADLEEKQWVIYVADGDTDALRGFSTQALLEVPGEAGPVRALYSGDTIMDQHARTSTALTRWWGRLALSLIDQYGDGPLYWFLISKGYKTYRFLPVFFGEYYPRYDRPTPPWARRAIDALGAHKFPEQYDPGAGIVRATSGGCRLREGVARITDRRLKDPHVRYFVEANPGHEQGDELCCLAPLSRENFLPAAYRAIGDPEGQEIGSR